MTTLLDEDLLTPSDAAEVLDLSGDMVRLLARSGRLPTAARSVRGARMFRRGDVDQLAAERAGRLVCDHSVQFYESTAYLSQTVGAFIAGALAQDARGIIIATPPHRAAIQDALEQQGHGVRALQQDERLIFLDARQALSQFMVNGTPDAVQFRQTIGTVVERYASALPKARLHAYGEMVDVLWKDGATQAALELEELWNELGRELPFNLLCGYAMTDFHAPGHAHPFERVCAAHTRVAPTEHYQRHTSRDGRLREIASLQRQSVALELERQTRERLERELHHARDQLVQSERSRDALLHRLSHELRNPLAPIVTALELSTRMKDPARQNAVITRQVKQLAKAIDGLISEAPARASATELTHLDTPRADESIESAPSAPRHVLDSALRVLVVDDNVDAAESLAEVLAELGYAARVAFNGATALEVARDFQPHAGLLDIGLPGMSGVELARKLKAQTATAHMRLVALTGYSRAADREQSLAAGCEAHLVKPVELHALETTLERLLEGRKGP